MPKKTTDQTGPVTLRMKARQLMELERKYEIKNIMSPDAEDLKRIASLSFLTEAISIGTEWMGDAAPDPGEMTVRELLELFRGFHEGKS